MTIEWEWRSREPAKSPPHPEYPDGIRLNVATPTQKACVFEFTYPAPGVGTWLVVCDTCGFKVNVTAAGRVDDPLSVRVPCKRDNVIRR